MKVLLRDVQVVDPAAGPSSKGSVSVESNNLREDVLIAGGKVAERGEDLEKPLDALEIDCGGQYMLPGICDLRVFFGEPGNEQRESAQVTLDSAANGGITCVLAMPDCEPALDSVAAVRYLKSLSTHSIVQTESSACITRGFASTDLAPMLELVDEGIKIFTNGASPVANAETLRRAMAYLGPRAGTISDFPLEPSLAKGAQMHAGALAEELGMAGFPVSAELLGLARAIWLAQETGAALHLPAISCSGSVDFLRTARSADLRFSSECCVLNLALLDVQMRSFDTALKQLPPLRSEADVGALLDGLVDGTLDCVSSNHRACALHEKDVEFNLAAFGSRNLELLLPLLWQAAVTPGRMSPLRFAEVTSLNPRRILGLEPLSFEPGADANFTLLSTKTSEIDVLPTIGSDISLSRVQARARYTFNNGVLWDCSTASVFR